MPHDVARNGTPNWASIGIGLIISIVLVSGCFGMGGASGMDIRIECKSARPKEAFPADLCALFRARLTAAYPESRIVDDSGPNQVTAQLLVLHATAGRLEARLDWNFRGHEDSGTPLGTAVADSRLMQERLAAFFDTLISQSPMPSAAR